MKSFATFCLLAVSVAGIDTAQADDGCCKPACCDQQPCLDSCKLLICRAEVKTIKVSKTCFKVECDHKCIPAITFPWQKKKSNCGNCNNCYDGDCQGECLAPKCGKVISINVLKKEKYDVEKCVCEWNIEEVPCVVSCCKPSCCCDEVSCGSTIVPSTPAKQEVAPPPPLSTTRPPLFGVQ